LLAQLVEQVTLNHRVGGSSPSQPTLMCRNLRTSEMVLIGQFTLASKLYNEIE
jgi:hypothetical protein